MVKIDRGDSHIYGGEKNMLIALTVVEKNILKWEWL